MVNLCWCWDYNTSLFFWWWEPDCTICCVSGLTYTTLFFSGGGNLTAPYAVTIILTSALPRVNVLWLTRARCDSLHQINRLSVRHASHTTCTQWNIFLSANWLNKTLFLSQLYLKVEKNMLTKSWYNYYSSNHMSQKFC